jgi:4-amino-4-deoxy-L-arabinose transferase-like glycosyltransferase
MSEEARRSAERPLAKTGAGGGSNVRKTGGAWFVVAILALAAFLRLFQLASAPPGLYHDEAMNGNNCLENLETGHWSLFYPENGGREGLYINLTALSVSFLGNTALALRLPAALFGILTVWGVYLLGRELFSRPIGLLASFFVATSFWHLVFSRLALRAIAAPLFLTLGLYLLLAGLRRVEEGRRHLGVVVLAGMVYGLGFHTYIAYRVTPLLAGAILWHGFHRLRGQGRSKAFWTACAAFGAATAAVCAPLALYFLRYPDSFLARSWQVSVAHNPSPVREIVLNTWRTARMFFTWGDRNWRHNYAYRAELFWPVAVLLVLGILTAVVTLSRHGGNGRDRRFPCALLLLWLAGAALPAILSDDFLPHALRSILLIPPVFLLAAAGAHWAYGTLSARAPRAVLTPLAIGLLLVLAYEPYRTYFDRWAPNPNVAKALEFKESDVARKINALPRQAPKYVALNTAGGLLNGLPVEALPIQYLTRSYTRKQQEQANIRYLSPGNFPAPPGADFCQAVSSSFPAGTVFCVQ